MKGQNTQIKPHAVKQVLLVPCSSYTPLRLTLWIFYIQYVTHTYECDILNKKNVSMV